MTYPSSGPLQKVKPPQYYRGHRADLNSQPEDSQGHMGTRALAIEGPYPSLCRQGADAFGCGGSSCELAAATADNGATAPSPTGSANVIGFGDTAFHTTHILRSGPHKD